MRSSRGRRGPQPALSSAKARTLARVTLAAVAVASLAAAGFSLVAAAPCRDFILDSFPDYAPPSSPGSDSPSQVTNRLGLPWVYSRDGSDMRLASAPADDAVAGTYHLAGASRALKLEPKTAGGKAWFLTPLNCRIPMRNFSALAFTITTTWNVNYGVSFLTGNCPSSVNASSDNSTSPPAPGISYWYPVRHGETTFVGVNPNISETATTSTLFTENVYVDLGKIYGDDNYHPRLSHIAFEGFPPNAEVYIKDVVLLGSPLANCTSDPPRGLTLFDPGAGKFHYGASIDWMEETPKGYVEKLAGNVVPTLWNSYIVFGRGFPRADLIHQWASQLLEVNATDPPIFNLFAMPNEPASPGDPAEGLARVTPYAMEGLAECMRQVNLRGVGVVVTLGHEPNGFWYKYGHQPANYTAFFRATSLAIKRRTKQTAVALLLNSANVYWSDALAYDPLLDTNGNGVLDPTDNPYTPYFPGREYVDWIGISLYFYGIEFPWGVNEVPPPTRFADALLGTYGTNGHGIYQLAERENLPLFVFETSAAYFTAANATGPNRGQLMHLWRRQVYNPETFKKMPLLRGIQWFEHRHFEEGTARDYRAAATPAEAAELVADLDDMGVIDGRGGYRISHPWEGWWEHY
ncbi:hypothetical protein DFJ74DRAFT_357788 [Hyaloraphidium curvatum]|nr:hypothetical protein DFJ74DRAFT_357788 [Hyaloraphidium curvatum]